MRYWSYCPHTIIYVAAKPPHMFKMFKRILFGPLEPSKAKRLKMDLV